MRGRGRTEEDPPTAAAAVVRRLLILHIHGRRRRHARVGHRAVRVRYTHVRTQPRALPSPREQQIHARATDPSRRHVGRFTTTVPEKIQTAVMSRVLTDELIKSCSGQFDLESVQRVDLSKQDLCSIVPLGGCKNVVHVSLAHNHVCLAAALAARRRPARHVVVTVDTRTHAACDSNRARCAQDAACAGPLVQSTDYAG